MGETDQTRWVGVRPIEPAETIPVSDRRLKMCKASAYDVTVDPNGAYEFLSVSGAGKIDYFKFESDNIPAADARMSFDFDGLGYEEGTYPWDIASCYNFNLTSVGFHNLGRITLQIYIWNTSSNIYQMRKYLIDAYFAESLKVRLRNLNSLNSATMYITFRYNLFTSSRSIKVKTHKHILDYVHEIRKMVKKDFGQCDAVVWQIEAEKVKGKENVFVNIPYLHIVVNDDVYKLFKDKIINRLIKEGCLKQ
ncbi:MAG: hypothetical protein DRH24_06475 [Deltaproteobacteria bacterium]|nr:MAG: hypothetical protein DRH24_06475 [Deltaproteobacteria bacterium]